MIQQAVLGYLANGAWQAVLVAAGAAILFRLVRLGPDRQCRAWSAFLLLAVLIPANVPLGLSLHSQSSGETFALRKAATPHFRPITPAPQPVLRRNTPSDSGFDNPRLVIEPALANLLTGLYALVLALGGGRLLLKLTRARRLKRTSRAAAIPARLEAVVHAFAARHGIKPPTIRTSALLSSPAMVGLRKPAILIPEDFVDYDEPEAITALLHECAHVVRRDYGFNILCELLALPLIWHPAVHLMRARISDSREMACDRLAAEQMDDRTGYARSLIALTERAFSRKSLVGAQPLLGGANLAKRVEAVLCAGDDRQRAVVSALAFAVLPVILAPAFMPRFTPAIAPDLPPASLLEQGRRSIPEPGLAVAAGMAAQLVNGASSPAGRAEGLALASVRTPSPLRSLVLPAPTLPPASAPAILTRVAAEPSAAVRKGGDALLTANLPPSRAHGRQPYSDEERQDLKYNGIGADEIAAFVQMGYGNLTARQLIELHYLGISARFVGQLSSAGFRPFTPDELIMLRFQGVSAGEIASLGRIGHSTLSAADLVHLHYQGVTPRFVDKLVSLGYENLSADALTRMFYSGMVPAPSRDLGRHS